MEKKYYIVNFTGTVYFKIATDKDVMSQIKEWERNQNKGEAKSDKIHLKSCVPVSEREFNDHLYPDYSRII